MPKKNTTTTKIGRDAKTDRFIFAKEGSDARAQP